ncbi:hypothetical protein CN140_01820 [Sinorhizobium meliloti]|uniref:hypothetical protein n=1 Tax=Rhizobium meliloti TaxID=382 RepID=UPI000FDBB7C4|nr:hypothetical protein [Sinorhizobium meliloti]RVL87695.1 hypothetical protein CN140_01820 [Sinorhizobium meliloti]
MSDNQDLRERLKLKYLPFDPTPETVDRVDAFLGNSDEEQTAFLKTVPDVEADFWISLLTARALYKDPVDRNPGSITEDKVDRYPDRYRWSP